jgi:4-hydroxybenzoate polyprenyltransferase
MHPRKRFRPIASGQLSLRTARSVVALLLLVGLPLAYLESPAFAGLAVAYMLLNLAYTKWFKHIPILDVMVLASFYVIRVGAGVELIDVSRFSPWLYVFTSFLALFLGVGKRRAELSLLEGEADAHRKVLGGYSLPLLDQLMGIVSSMTIITYSLYTFSAPNLPENHTMMLTIPFVIYGIFRYLYLMQIKQSGGAPEEVLFNDQGMQLALLGFSLAILIIFYL